MSAMDQAADAFSKEMNGGTKVSSDTAPATLDFGDVFAPRQIEQDEVAGGDEELTAEEIAANSAQREVEGRKPARKAKAPVEDEEVDPIYGDDDAEEKAEPEEGDEEEDDAEEGNEDPDADAEEFELDDHADKKVKVVVDGEEKEVTVKEAVEGYIRTETFHQRLNEINTARTEIRVEAQKLLTNRKEAITLLDQLEKDTKDLLPAEPDWDQAFAADPNKARALQKQYKAMETRLNGIRTQRAEQQRLLQTEQTDYIKQFAASEKDKFEGLKENQHWRSDAKKHQKDLSAMVRTAKSVGLTDDEIRGTLDSRLLTILLRASKYDRMVARAPKQRVVQNGKISAKPGAVNGGNRTRRSAQKGLGRAQQQLSKTGSVNDATAVFQHLL